MKGCATCECGTTHFIHACPTFRFTLGQFSLGWAWDIYLNTPVTDINMDASSKLIRSFLAPRASLMGGRTICALPLLIQIYLVQLAQGMNARAIHMAFPSCNLSNIVHFAQDFIKFCPLYCIKHLQPEGCCFPRSPSHSYSGSWCIIAPTRQFL